MWQHIRLSSLGVIDDAELELGEGFTVITGETGAGKTMVVTALGLLRGARADSGLVRHGAGQARVEATVELPTGSALAEQVGEAGGSVDDGTLVLGRVLSAQGRSRAYVGAAAPAALLTSVTDELVAVHGQSDQHRLLQAAEQRAALDGFAGAPLTELLDQYRPVHARLLEVSARLAGIREDAQARARELDLRRFGLGEIDAVDPQEGEDEQLQAEENRLAHAESLVRAALTAHEGLVGEPDGGARAYVAGAQAALDEASGQDPALDALAGRLREVAIELDDLGLELSSYASSVEMDPARLATVQERRAAIIALLRKYGPTLDDVLAWRAESLTAVEELDDEQVVGRLEAEQRDLEKQARELAGRMTAVREKAGAELATRVQAELAALAMPHARLTVAVRPRPDGRLGTSGADQVEMLFAANNGAEPRPLHRGASGGELSRLMLALEVVLVDARDVPTLVFDEVDAGIGGRAAVEVGRRLARLARRSQVLAVTHLPQVAAFADHHFHVQKDDDGVVTRSAVVVLEGEARVDELARMLAGQDDSAAAQAHARELLDLARE